MKSRRASMDFDIANRKIWLALERDFTKWLGPVFRHHRSCIETGDIKGFRELSIPSFLNLDPLRARCVIQLNKFLSRYRFDNDLYTDKELLEKQVEKDLLDQFRILQHSCKPWKTSTFMVVQEARKFISEVLGNYDYEAHINLCKFGTRACVGSPLRKAYLDLKLLENPLTGSDQHISWFKEHLGSDKVLKSVLKNRTPKGSYRFTRCDKLSQGYVPKSYSKLRGITPNTLIGTFWTSGLGELMVERLDASLNYDLARRPEKHKDWARKASMDRKHVTADLSSASQSITVRHLKTLFPRDWVKAMLFGRIDRMKIGDQDIQTPTLAGMGIGFTFPMQTLVFLGILNGISRLLRINGRISVFGDDLIYPRTMHRYVIAIFDDLGFKINEEKTFCYEKFRESCGGDFHRGIDCRPVSPSGCNEGSRRNVLCSYLYKVINNLLCHWEPEEIPGTLHVLYTMIHGERGEVFVVPPSFPEYSGVRVLRPWSSVPLETWYHSIVKPKWNREMQAYNFKFMELRTATRVVTSVYPYYWDKLRSSTNPKVRSPYSAGEPSLRTIFFSMAYKKPIKLKKLREVAAKGKQSLEKLSAAWHATVPAMNEADVHVRWAEPERSKDWI